VKLKPTWEKAMIAELKEAIAPATQRALTKDEAYRLIIVSAKAMRQGLSIDFAIPDMLDDLFETE
jgi:hypothetical protein